jgi:hypothetical protein
MATRLAKTPLAIADAHAPGAPIMFANEAFAELVDIDVAALVGRPIGTLAASDVADIRPGSTSRFELAIDNASPFPVALSVAAVAGADGTPLCLLCSLVDARGENADATIARDVQLLAQVAQAAGDLMRESAIAASLAEPGEHADTAAGIALGAVERATHPAPEARS